MIGREAAKVIGLHHPLTRSRAVAVEKTSLSLSVPLSERFFVYMFHVSRCKHTGSELHDPRAPMIYPTKVNSRLR